MKRHILRYSDYEDADAHRVDEMERLITKNGGKVVKTIADEEDGTAYIGYLCEDKDYSKIVQAAEEEGWEIY